MWRVSFSFNPMAVGTFDGSRERISGLWDVKKCYDVRKESVPFTAPVRVSTDHGRKRLLILCPERIAVHESHTPFELLRCYLHALPVDIKIEREREMRGATP